MNGDKKRKTFIYRDPTRGLTSYFVSLVRGYLLHVTTKTVSLCYIQLQANKYYVCLTKDFVNNFVDK